MSKTLATRIVPCLILSAVLGGCLILPKDLADERPFGDEELAFIREGVTNKSEVVDELGIPSMTYFDDEWWRYSTRQDLTDWMWIYWIPGWTEDLGDFEVGGEMDSGSRRFDLLVHFDLDDTIREIALVTEDDPCNRNRTICLESGNLLLRSLAGESLSISAGEKPSIEIDVLQSGDLDLVRRDGLVYERGRGDPYTGTVTTRHDDGWIERTVNYEDGMLNGAKTIWYKNGKKRYEARYVDGHRHGLVTFWDTDGLNPETECYQDGRVAIMSQCLQQHPISGNGE